MRTRAKGTSRAAVLAAGFVALGVTAIPSNAFADVTSGNGGVLSGNQVNAPISVPVNVCGNAVAIAGTASALCENAPGYGGSDGDDGYGGYRAAGVPMPAAFPALPGVATDMPATPGGLPGLPPANGRHAAHHVLPATDVALPQNTPPQLDGVPSAGGLTQVGGLQNLLALPPVSGRAAPGNLLPMDGIASATHDLLANHTLPAADTALPRTALPQLGGVSTVDGRRAKGDLPGTDGLVPASTLPGLNGGRGSDGLPGVDGLLRAGLLPAVGSPVRDIGAARRGGAPVAVSVLDTRALPGGGVVRRPIGLRAVDALRSPARVAVPATPVTGHEIVPARGGIGPVRNVAAEEPVSDGAGSLWALAASGMLGVLAGSLTLARRVRLDGRR